MSDLINSKMAYVVWRVMMKKYNKVRLGITKNPQLPAPPTTPVTPSDYDNSAYEESWRSKPEEHESKENSPELVRTDVRKSTTKKVKKYFKKCKYALSKSSSSSDACSSTETFCSSSRIDKQAEESLQEATVSDLKDVFEDECFEASINNDISEKLAVANVVEVKVTTGFVPENSVDTDFRTESGKLERVVSENLEPLIEQVQELLSGSDGKCFSGETANADKMALGTLPLLTTEQERDEGERDAGLDFRNVEIEGVKCDVASLVDRYFGKVYVNFSRTRKTLIRQARDVLVCEYQGSLQKFEEGFCIPASKLLLHIKNENLEAPISVKGWPLSLGPSGVVVHLSPLSSSLIRNRDCYLCIRNRSAPGLELALVWRKSTRIHCQTLVEFKDLNGSVGGGILIDDVNMCSTLTSPAEIENCALNLIDEGSENDLPELLQNLLVSVEHAIERVPLDDLVMPCPHCLMYLPLERQEDSPDGVVCSCQCSCFIQEPPLPSTIKKKDTSIQTSPMFEFAGSIPHIDSDEDEEGDFDKNGISIKKPVEIQTPKRITDLPEKLLMSGINLPGTVDIDGRPIILCYSECIARAGLNKYEIAKLLLYYTSIPSAEDISKGFTILLLAETCEQKVADSLIKSVALITNHLRLEQFIIWSPQGNAIKPITSKHKVVVVSEEADLEKYISKSQAPASCGGTINHDQLEWVEFFRQYEPFVASCRTSGHALLSALSLLRSEEVPTQVTRRFLNHQCRQISRALHLESVQKIRKDGTKILSSLEERAQWLSGNKDVKRCALVALNTYNSVDQVTRRLEDLAQQRRDRLKELARLKTLEDEANVLLKWIQNVGEDTLKNQNVQLRTVTSSSHVKEIEKNFEKFYFDALRQIDKATDLVDESANIPDTRGKTLKDSANQLKTEAKIFNEKLEDVREDIDACFKSFQTVENRQNLKNFEHVELSSKLSKLGNSKLNELFKNLKIVKEADDPSIPPDKSTTEYSLNVSFNEGIVSSTPIKSAASPTRRRSVSSHAFIYKCNHHAAGMSCNCYESDTENSVSYKLKKKYLQSLQSCGCTNGVINGVKDTLDRKNSLTLDGIKEVRESVENLLDIEKNDSGLSGCGRCDSGVSTAENSIGEEISLCKKKLQRTCSCQFYRESCVLCSTGSSSTGSNQDQTENQQDSVIEESSDGFMKSGSDDIEEENYNEERRKISPISANSHLHCHSSSLHLPIDTESKVDPKTQKTLLFIMREMIQTERDYVNSLDYVIENYIPELMREDIPQALRGQRNVVFGNIEKIYEFHSQHFLRELEQCENNPLQVGQIFLKHDKKFYLYALYNKNKPKSDSLMSEYGGTFFKTKQIQLGDKMDLASYLLKPVQRMGKYALLLQQMMKACPPLPPNASERSVSEQEDLKQAEQMVRFQLRHGNDLLAMDSIRECDVNLKEQGRLLRQNEFLVWEGRSGKKSLRQVFLFEELILFSKARRFPDQKNLDLYIYKNSIKMTDIGLTAKIGDSPTKFEIWFRKRKPNDTFTLQSMSEDIKKAWAEELSQLLWKQAIRNREEVRMAEMSSMGIGNKPCLDIKPSADQISDRSISVAQLSKTAPRFRNSIVGPVAELYRSMKRPHSIISMSSISSGSTSSGSSTSGSGNVQTSVPAANLSFEAASCDNAKAFHRSGTLNSQCSVESGIIADISIGSEERPESPKGRHWPLEKSNSRNSNTSSEATTATRPTQSDDTQVTSIFIVPDLPVNI